jgi:murein L,D-transpeptidase YcbB/YkuD
LRHGILKPKKIDKKIERANSFNKNFDFLSELQQSNPFTFFKNLFPPSSEYKRLMKEKHRLEKLLANGGWGASISINQLSVGEQGDNVVLLRNRLISMSYLLPTYSSLYDLPLVKAVKEFQSDNGIPSDGSANQRTLNLINVKVEERLKSVLVAMERERWSRTLHNDRHVVVNLTDFTAKIIDSGKVTFETKAIIGFDDLNRRSPEFSDILEFMVVNPSWYVPRSIAVQEYLPMLKVNSNAVNFLELRDSIGNIIQRDEVDFSNFDQDTFPYSMRQPPGVTNALGLVKFMFPNENNIYLHDTPSKRLFELDVRAFSHGCIRLNDPFGFAFALLAVQSDDPISLFHFALDAQKEVKIMLKKPIPIHLIYRTAITKAGGGLQFRKDIYGRDAKIWDALRAEGVVLGSVTG